ncbi:hypothetical protein TKK_0018627 [Trichogramma kaykai]
MECSNKTEEEARKAYQVLHPEFQIVETGLIISQDNPWLGYSLDSLLIDGSTKILLEIKCPTLEKTKNISEVISDQIGKCLVKQDDNIFLKQKHKYY